MGIEKNNDISIDLEKFKKIKPADILIGVLIISAIIIQLGFISEMKQLPSPLYGGDYYAQLGAINHVRYGGSAFVTSNTLDDLPPVYLPLYTWLVANFANIFNLESINAMFYFSLIAMVASIIVAYLLFNEIFKNKNLSLIGTVLFLSITSFPILKYTHFLTVFLVPLFLLLFFRFYKNPNWKNAIASGVLFGLVGLTHGTGIIIAASVLFVFAFYRFIVNNFSNGKFNVPAFKKNAPDLKFYAAVFGIGFAISLLYLYRPLFVLGGSIPNYSLMWGTENLLDFGIFFNFFLRTLKGVFLNFSSISGAIVSILSIAGIFFLAFMKNRSENTKFIAVLLVDVLILVIHPLISGPIMHKHFVPIYLFGELGFLSVIILSVFALDKIKSMVKGRNIQIAAFSILLILVLSSQAFAWKNKMDDRWVQAGRTELSPVMEKAGEWVLKNTGVNDVILSTNENAFAIDALSGRKSLLNRRTHMSMFMDVDKNYIDAAIILYGNDTKKRAELLKERNVKYLYWDVNWLDMEYSIQDGKIANVFDPIALIYSQEREETLKKYNISYTKVHTWLDPAGKDPSTLQMDILYVFPSQWDIQKPWNPDLDNYLEQVWDIKSGNYSVAKIFRVIA
jgi:hypothetical protein